MSNAIDAHLTDEVINAAFENTNFGRNDFRTILAETVMKREAAEKAILEEGETWWNEEQLASDYGLALHWPDAKLIAAANPAAVLRGVDYR